MNRRSFFRLFGSVLAAAVVPWKPKPLAFRADAFSSLRFVEQYNIQTDQKISRLDVLYGPAMLAESFSGPILEP